MRTWKFSPTLGESRSAMLDASPPFDVIAKQIADQMRILCTHIEPCGEAHGFKRLVSCISIDAALFDLFFNSETGYRGRYFVSREEGFVANSLLLGLVAARVVQFKTHTDMIAQDAEQSLRLSSAKVWLAETGMGLCAACAGEWTHPQDYLAEILNGRWEHGDATSSRIGRKAPLLRQLRILGAFVNGDGGEYISARKRKRADELHSHGWA
jgi:hypothetical protein